MNRRDLLRTALASAVLAKPAHSIAQRVPAGRVVTVTGAISPARLGITLPHEHVMVDFIGADKATPERYVPDTVFEKVLPHLKQLRQAGCQSLIDCTPAYLARDPLLLKRLSEASGLQILTNTGWYGARDGKYLPKPAFNESAEQIANRWIAEWRDGIENTGVRPGFIKIGVDKGPLSPTNRKLVQAAAKAHLNSGLTIACHTGDGAAALEEIDILREDEVDPSAWVWVHAQNERDPRLHEQAASRGGWVEFDGIGPDTIERHVELVSHMKDRGLLGRVLLSQDAGWYSVGEPGGGKFRPYTAVFERFIPALKKAGFSDGEIQRLMADNPARAFTVRVRRTP
jgi:phosphotriesterase-related protein